VIRIIEKKIQGSSYEYKFVRAWWSRGRHNWRHYDNDHLNFSLLADIPDWDNGQQLSRLRCLSEKVNAVSNKPFHNELGSIRYSHVYACGHLHSNFVLSRLLGLRQIVGSP